MPMKGAFVVSTELATITVRVGVAVTGCFVHGVFATYSASTAWLDSAVVTVTSLRRLLRDNMVDKLEN
jgi:NhaP-type Na+/H+ or K+/H+ antiporter